MVGMDPGRFVRGMPKFGTGDVVATPGVLQAVPRSELMVALGRHTRGDWGQLDPEDWQANDEALESGSRLLSAYHARNGTRFWIITEADRSVTTLLRPEEY